MAIINNNIRINRKEPEVAVVALQPILRINRKNKIQASTLKTLKQQSSTAKERKLTRIDEYLLVVVHSFYGHLDRHSLEVVMSAEIIAHQQSSENHQIAVLVVCAGKINPSIETALAKYGADLIAPLNYQAERVYAPEILARAIKIVIDEFQPRHTFFADSESFGAEVLRFLMVQNDFTFASDINQISLDSISRKSENERSEISHPLTQLIGLKPNVSEGNLPYLSEAKIINHQAIKKANLFLEEKLKPSDSHKIKQLAANSVSLEESKFIASAGNGVKDINQFIQLAELLGASIGGSRVVVDDGKLPRDKQIGLTGKVVQSQVYLALGISGAIQHLQGIENCQYVIAVNKDASCPMVKRANLALIANLDELIPEFIKQVKQVSQ